jgi:hypothetical protein
MVQERLSRGRQPLTAEELASRLQRSNEARQQQLNDKVWLQVGVFPRRDDANSCCLVQVLRARHEADRVLALQAARARDEETKRAVLAARLLRAQQAHDVS